MRCLLQVELSFIIISLILLSSTINGCASFSAMSIIPSQSTRQPEHVMSSRKSGIFQRPSHQSLALQILADLLLYERWSA